MEKLIGKLSVAAEGEPNRDHHELVEDINRVIKPSLPVTAESVYIGVLHAASDKVNLQGGCFELPELERLAELIVDAPVLVGHQKQELPIGRVFKGEVVQKQGTPWLRAYFYWHRDQKDAEALKAGIDAGIYKECSLGFLYGKPECCICREDMRHCRHRLHEVVHVGGREIKAFYYYKQIERILEISLVYRGAVEGTEVSALTATPSEPPRDGAFPLTPTEVVFDLTQITAPLGEVMIEPLYRGLWLQVSCVGGKIAAHTQDGSPYDHLVLKELGELCADTDFTAIALLVPVRGGSRLPLRSLCCAGNGRRDCGCILFLVDLLTIDGRGLRRESITSRKQLLSRRFPRSRFIRPIPYHICRFLDIKNNAFARGSAEGLRIIDLEAESENGVFEVRHKRVVRGRVMRNEMQSGRSAYAIAFEGDDNTMPVYPLDAAGYSLEAGTLIWAELSGSGELRFRYVDHCPGVARVDSRAVVNKLARERGSARFSRFVGASGDTWVALSGAQPPRLLRIGRLSLPLLARGRKFWCRFVDTEDSHVAAAGKVSLAGEGEIVRLEEAGDGRILLELRGPGFSGSYVIEPTRFGKEVHHLFFRQG